MLLELMVEDQRRSRRWGRRKSNARIAARTRMIVTQRFGAALLMCIRVPQSIGAAAAAILDLCGTLAPMVNRYLLSDLAVCAELSMAYRPLRRLQRSCQSCRCK